MAESQNASFIPKNTQSGGKRRIRVTRRIYIISYISYIIFFGTLLIVLGTFFYANQVEQALRDKEQQLQVEQKRFSEADITSVRNLEKRLLTAEKLVSDTTAPSQIFSALESVVTQSVKFQKFTYEVADTGTFALAVEGTSDNLNDVIFQRDQLLLDPLLQSASIVNFDYTGSESESGVAADTPAIVFTFENTLSSSELPYNPALYEAEAEVASSTDFFISNETNE